MQFSWPWKRSLVQTSDATIGGEKEMTFRNQPSRYCVTADPPLVKNARIFILVLCLSVAPSTEINQQQLILLCFSVLDHYWNLVLLLSKSEDWTEDYETLWNRKRNLELQEVPGLRTSHVCYLVWPGSTLEFLTGIVQCALTALQKLWDLQQNQ